jgi:hypothetical protein
LLEKIECDTKTINFLKKTEEEQAFQINSLQQALQDAEKLKDILNKSIFGLSENIQGLENKYQAL